MANNSFLKKNAGRTVTVVFDGVDGSSETVNLRLRSMNLTEKARLTDSLGIKANEKGEARLDLTSGSNEQAVEKTAKYIAALVEGWDVKTDDGEDIPFNEEILLNLDDADFVKIFEAVQGSTPGKD